MIKRKIQIEKVVQGKSTYPSWSTNSEYLLETSTKNGKVIVHYKINGGRKIEREFPESIDLTPRLCYVLGLIKGEGANSLGKSNYRRFTLTNSDPAVIKLVLSELENAGFLNVSEIPDSAFHLLHFKKSEDNVKEYWSNNLGLPKEKFKCFNDKNKTSDFGVCHLYLSDVLLRRTIDLIQEYITL